MHRHANTGRKLKRDKGPRGLMLRNLATSVLLHEKVRTTVTKAKEIRPVVEKLITKAKKGDLNAQRILNSYLLDENAVKKTITELAPLYKDRKGGYTRIVKIGKREGDASEMAYIELLDIDKLVKKEKPAKTQKSKEERENVSVKKKSPRVETKAKDKAKTKVKK